MRFRLYTVVTVRVPSRGGRDALLPFFLFLVLARFWKIVSPLSRAGEIFDNHRQATNDNDGRC